MPGRFIVLEGTDGSGTTTQCELLVQALGRRGFRAMATREPTRGPVGQLLRAALEKRLSRGAGETTQLDWRAMALLFAADRVDHVVEEIEPALNGGFWVVSDRYDLSSLIYQSLTAPPGSSALPWLRELNVKARRPDLVVVLDVDASDAERRRLSRGAPEELFERRELQLKLVEAYRDAERFAQQDCVVHVDGGGNIAEVAASVLAAVDQRFSVRIAES